MSISLTRRAALWPLAGLLFAQGGASDLERVKVGEAAPELDLPSLEGGRWKLADARGKNLVLVFYRGYW